MSAGQNEKPKDLYFFMPNYTDFSTAFVDLVSWSRKNCVILHSAGVASAPALLDDYPIIIY